jgi:deoxycytidylate deaminase
MSKQTITAIVKDKRGRVLAVGQNSYVKTHPLQAWAAKKVGTPARIFLHAEVAALLKCDWSKAHSLFVSRYGEGGKPVLAKPCPSCMHIIKMAGIKKVEHT